MNEQSQVTYRVTTIDIVFWENCLYCLTLVVVNSHGIIFVVLVFPLSSYMIVYTNVTLKTSVQECTFVRNRPLILIFSCPGHPLITALSDRFTPVKYVYIIIIVIVIVVVTVIVIIILIVIIIIIIMVLFFLFFLFYFIFPLTTQKDETKKITQYTRNFW